MMALRNRCPLAVSRQGPQRLNLRPSAMPRWFPAGSLNPAHAVVKPAKFNITITRCGQERLTL
uniref:Uncharacterized protein n=1 Tax=Arundo donax TaxID=35708 RepID=A0A0A9E0T3_ARUDO